MNELGIPLQDLSFDVWVLVALFIFGIIGLWLFREGRRRENKHIKYIGLAMMMYPYFVEGRFWNWGIGLALCFAAYHFWN